MPQETTTAHGDAGTGLTLFGRPTVLRGGQAKPIADPALAALAAYLVLHDTEAVPLPILAGLSHAATTKEVLAETRESLNRLGDLLGQATLTASGNGIGIDTDAIAIDVVAFERESSGTALHHYKGRLLDGIDEAAFQPPFVAWLDRQRRRLHERALMIGLSAMKDLLEFGDTAGALEVGGQLLDLEPALESAHRMMMQAWFDIGQRDRAIEQFEFCSAALGADGNRRPQVATTALRDRYLKAAQATAPEAPVGVPMGADTDPVPVTETASPRKIRNFINHPTTLLAACVVVAFSVIGLQVLESITHHDTASGPAGPRSDAAATAPAPTTLSVIAITAFAAAQNDRTPAYLGPAIGQELAWHFGSISNLFVIDLTSGTADPSAITARYVLTGEFSQDEVPTLSSVLVDRQTGTVVWRHKVATPLDRLSATLARIVRGFAAAHRLPSSLPVEAPPPAVAADDMKAYLKARTDAAGGRYDNARLGLDRQLAESPGFPAMHLFRADLAWRALTAEADGQALGPTAPSASAERAAFDNALTFALAAGMPAAHRLEAVQLMADGRHDAAVGAARKAVAARANDAAAHATLAEMLIYGGDSATALDHIDRSSRLAPLALGRIAWLIGLARLGGSSPAEAASDLARAERRQAARADFAGFLGRALVGGTSALGSTRPQVDHVLSRLPFRDPETRDRIARRLVAGGLVQAAD